MSDEFKSQGRRPWMARILAGGIAASVGGLVYPIARFLKPRGATRSGALGVKAPFRVNELKPDVNGEWPSPLDLGGKPCLVVRTADGEIKALSAVCTHRECTVKYRPDKGDIFCSCHGAVYDTHGHNVSGPPPRPLEAYKVILRGHPGQEDIIVVRS